MCGWVDAAPSRRRLLKCCLMPGRSADRTAQGFTVDSKPAKHEVLIRRPIVLYGAAFLLRDAPAGTAQWSWGYMDTKDRTFIFDRIWQRTLCRNPE